MQTEIIAQSSTVLFGEIMLRLDCPPGQRFRRNESFTRFFGGAEANVSVVLSQLGLNTRYVTSLPDNDLGQAAIDSMRAFGVNTSFVHRGGERMGIYFTEHGNNIRASRVIYDRTHSAFASLQPGLIDWNGVFNDVNCFFWTGISASLTGNATACCEEAIAVARSKKIPIAADMNYRRTLWNYGKKPAEVMPGLLSGCEIITGDLDTIDVYFGIKETSGTNEEKFQFCAEALRKKLPAMKTLSMTFRGVDEFQQQTYSGALMKDGDYFFSPLYALPQIVDRIGSGDAFQGGLLYGLLNGLSAQDTINFAIACGAIKHSTEGDFALLSKAEALQFISSGAVNRINR